MQELKRQSLKLDQQDEALDESEQRLKGALAQAGGRRDEAASEVEVRIEAKAPCKGAFTLTHYVRNAGWFPAYDIRSEGLSAPLEIIYKAHIFQNTREEWKDVALTLSSSNPTAGNIAPELKMWWLDYGLAPPQYDAGSASNSVEGVVFDEKGKPLVGASVTVPGTTVGTLTDANGRYALTLPTDATQLAFRLVGYKSRTRAITGEQLNVVLQPDSRPLDEEVVVAYGSSAKTRGRLAATSPVMAESVEYDFAEFEPIPGRNIAYGERLSVRDQTALHPPLRRPAHHRRDRTLSASGRLPLPRNAQDRPRRLPYGGSHRLGSVQPAGGGGQRLFRADVRRQEHPFARRGRRYAP